MEKRKRLINQDFVRISVDIPPDIAGKLLVFAERNYKSRKKFIEEILITYAKSKLKRVKV